MVSRRQAHESMLRMYKDKSWPIYPALLMKTIKLKEFGSSGRLPSKSRCNINREECHREVVFSEAALYHCINYGVVESSKVRRLAKSVWSIPRAHTNAWTVLPSTHLHVQDCLIHCSQRSIVSWPLLRAKTSYPMANLKRTTFPSAEWVCRGGYSVRGNDSSMMEKINRLTNVCIFWPFGTALPHPEKKEIVSGIKMKMKKLKIVLNSKKSDLN